jgi:hypothetical protein
VSAGPLEDTRDSVGELLSSLRVCGSPTLALVTSTALWQSVLVRACLLVLPACLLLSPTLALVTVSVLHRSVLVRACLLVLPACDGVSAAPRRSPRASEWPGVQHGVLVLWTNFLE